MSNADDSLVSTAISTHGCGTVVIVGGDIKGFSAAIDVRNAKSLDVAGVSFLNVSTAVKARNVEAVRAVQNTDNDNERGN